MSRWVCTTTTLTSAARRLTSRTTPELIPQDVLCLNSTTGRWKESAKRRSSVAIESISIKVAGIVRTTYKNRVAEDLRTHSIPKKERLFYKQPGCLRSLLGSRSKARY